MRLIVQKYGGTSVGTPERIRNVARRLLETQQEGCRVVGVISAMAGVTDGLIKLAREAAPQPAERELDALLATGELAAIAEITPTTLQPSCCVSRSRRATFRIRSGVPTEVPPYFWTIMRMARRNVSEGSLNGMVFAYLPSVSTRRKLRVVS